MYVVVVPEYGGRDSAGTATGPNRGEEVRFRRRFPLPAAISAPEFAV
jgi:hypothetical protein